MNRGTLFLLVACVLGSRPAAAHDFWIEPSSFRPAPGQRVALSLAVWAGRDFVGDPVPRLAELMESYTVAGPGGSRPVPGVEGVAPAGFLRPDAPGLYVVSYRSRPAETEIDAATFASYLAQEGLDEVASERRAGGEAALPVRDRFRRCAKALLLVGSAPSAGFDRPASCPIDLAPERDPYGLHAGDVLAIRLTLRGAPLAGALVTAIPREAPGEAIRARTDDAGRVRLHLARSGPWLIKAVHEERAPRGSGADWSSVWASLTFELPGG